MQSEIQEALAVVQHVEPATGIEHDVTANGLLALSSDLPLLPLPLPRGFFLGCLVVLSPPNGVRLMATSQFLHLTVTASAIVELSALRIVQNFVFFHIAGGSD